MKSLSISERCKINTNRNNDTFVGIECVDGELSFNFPMGYSFSKDEKELRRDILLVLNSIAITVGKKESAIDNKDGLVQIDGFPLQSYFYLIADYIEHGYYTEKEPQYKVNKRGKIHWGKTIKTQKPYVSETGIVYLDFVTKTMPLKENELITLIHKYCVYESFARVGWIFTSALPEKPAIKFNSKLFHSVIVSKLDQTFNDDIRRLLSNMLRIVDNKTTDSTDTNYRFGTNRFEYVWEKAIDRVFGIVNKQDYFPKTYWEIKGKVYENASLEPDTIMIYKDNVYVLDAKYYKYGITKIPSDLPESTSINKQITYGEYIDQDKFRQIHGEGFCIYNAFIMPYVSDDKPYLNCGIGFSDWKKRKKTYENIQGILIDLRHLLKMAVSNNKTEIDILADTIVNGIDGLDHKS